MSTVPGAVGRASKRRRAGAAHAAYARRSVTRSGTVPWPSDARSASYGGRSRTQAVWSCVAGPHDAVGRTRLCGAERLSRAVAVPCFRSARCGGHTARQLRRGDAVGGTPLKRSPGAPPGLFFAGGVTGRSVSWSDVRCGVRARCAAPRAGREAVVCRCERSESPSHGRRKPWRWRKREARHGKMAWDSG